jgi:hypothetical protein
VGDLKGLVVGVAEDARGLDADDDHGGG